MAQQHRIKVEEENLLQCRAPRLTLGRLLRERCESMLLRRMRKSESPRVPREPPSTILTGVAYERQNLQQATSFLILQYVHLPIDHCDDSLASQYSFYPPKAKIRRDPLRLLRA